MNSEILDIETNNNIDKGTKRFKLMNGIALSIILFSIAALIILVLAKLIKEF